MRTSGRTLVGLGACALAAGGCGGDASQRSPPDAAVDARPRDVELRISEIMYHPVLEDSYDDVHEWGELANVGRDPVPVGKPGRRDRFTGRRGARSASRPGRAGC